MSWGKPYIPTVSDVPGYDIPEMDDGDFQELPPGEHQSPYPYLDAPPVPGGAEHPGKGVTVVNTVALKNFADNLEQLKEPLQQAMSDIDRVELRPGAFHAAHALTSKVTGENQLTSNTHGVLTATLNTILDIAAAARELATRYSNTEDLTSLDAEGLLEDMSMGQVSGDINNYNPQ